MHARMTGKDCRAAGVRNHPGRAVLTGRPTQRTRRPVWVRARRSAADVFCGLLAVTLLAAVLAGVPYALVTVLGLPVPHGLPPMSEFTRQLGVIPILRILSVIVCAAWLQLAVCVLVEIRAAIRGVGLPARVPLSGRTQDFAHWLAAVQRRHRNRPGASAARHSAAPRAAGRSRGCRARPRHDGSARQH